MQRSARQPDAYWITPFCRTSALPLTTSTAPGVPSDHPTCTLVPLVNDLMKVAPFPTSFELNTTLLAAFTVIALVLLHQTRPTL